MQYSYRLFTMRWHFGGGGIGKILRKYGIPYSQKIVGESNLVVWWYSNFATAKLKSANVSYLHIIYMCVWWSLYQTAKFRFDYFCNWELDPAAKFNSHQYYRLYGMYTSGNNYITLTSCLLWKDYACQQNKDNELHVSNTASTLLLVILI